MKNSSKCLALWVLFGMPFLAMKDPLERMGPVLFSIFGVAMLVSVGTYIVLKTKEVKKARRLAAGGGEQNE